MNTNLNWEVYSDNDDMWKTEDSSFIIMKEDGKFSAYQGDTSGYMHIDQFLTLESAKIACYNLVNNFMTLEISPDGKKYTLEHLYPFSPVPDFEETRVCLNCLEEFRVKDYKVILSPYYEGTQVSCANPVCDGAPSHWLKGYYEGEYKHLEDNYTIEILEEGVE